jgi:hypothetical protein|eukprot:CAMPEP_0174302232 /NCGR_PEP_ID=MMETSP0809-20121228/59514_1 /TAXON_ID=73025 ORGANISM="Eutreptiella gymnastica-like, Strain CCMP1594" /NCGR_SAMPLE_ID=MMETSP0809 /ASSEMBLY_ACC=CAM_ASM_000658 /LENGTH=133 /DNA_ID=CAMNT_0015408119 /DNA_START=31 /DNA_END=432 /DNA_ORIENTATION=+
MTGMKRKAVAVDVAPKKKAPKPFALAKSGDAIADVFASLKERKQSCTKRAEDSTQRTAPQKTPSVAKAPPTKVERRSKSRANADDDDLFADSRGMKSGRKTVDGLTVYTPEELGLHTGGGDTPLCPFDCECCV